MSTFFIWSLAFIVVIGMAYLGLSLRVAAIISAGLMLLSWGLGGGVFLSLMLLILTALLGFLSVTSWRRSYISKPMFSWFIKVLPAISDTEQEAIDAGTVWWDGELFSGNPNWQRLLSMPKPRLTEEEQAFIEGPVKTLCSMVNNWQINHYTATIPDDIVQYIHEQGFLGMIIPKNYGGLEFSGMAQTEVITMVSATGGCVANYIAVPNSLGPGELLLEYGTEKQKDYYLPRLANGTEVPCFALTGPLVGSDATSIPDVGIVCERQLKGKTVLGVELNFNKRYITLSPVATLIGLAFKLQDPDHLIGEVDDYGITCALVPHDIKGIKIGGRHKPVGDAFLNGPIEGRDVFISLDDIIGGAKMAGKGWAMLVNSLSVGRCITLPSVSNSIAKHMLMGTSAYASLRQQFGLPIARFEGVQKPLARMAGLSFIINAARLHTSQSLSFGEKPAVPSAILKYHLTEMARQSTIDAMDIHGGKAIMMGPNNYVADAYTSVPIAITVEGANIMTRNLMIFGQGATRSHPYVLKEMQLAAKGINPDSEDEFDSVFFAHIGFALRNAARSWVLGITGGRLVKVSGNSQIAEYYRDISRLSAAFALVADVTMMSLQSKLKFKEMLSARLGDLLSNLYLASMVLKHHESEDCPDEHTFLVEWSVDFLTHRYQIAMLDFLQNYPNKLIALTLKFMVFPFGARFAPPSDYLDTALTKLVTSNSPARQHLLKGVFDQNLPTNPVGKVNAVFLQGLTLAPLNQKIKEAIKAHKIDKLPGKAQIEVALAAGVLNDSEAQKLFAFDKQLMDVIEVDSFDSAQLVRAEN